MKFHDVDFRIAQDELLLSELSSLCHHFAGVQTTQYKEYPCDQGAFSPGHTTLWMLGKYVHFETVNQNHNAGYPLYNYWSINQLHIIGIDL